MADFPALPWWTDAYLADTRHLTRDEHGAYCLLLMEAWRRPRCSLPDNDDLLARLTCSTAEEWAALKPVVMAFWRLDANACEWTQKRLSAERKFVDLKRAKNRSSAVGRWQKTKKDDANAYANAMPPHPHPHPQESKKESPSEMRKKADASPMAQPIAKPSALRGSRLPEGWRPSAEDLAYAQQRGLSREATEAMVLDFEQYWRAKAGKEAVKVDWHLTWQRWVRNSEQYGTKRNSSGNGREPYVSPKARIATELYHKLVGGTTGSDKGAERGNVREFTPKLISLQRGG